MQIVEQFGRRVDELSESRPLSARNLLKTGWQAQELKYTLAPDRRLFPADRYMARLMMDTMLVPLKYPQRSAIVSVFTPCELIQEAGLSPYNVESMSCYISASRAERTFLQQAENTGISETLCSYHKTFFGAAQKGLLPAPRCIVYTNLVCDANLLTFRALAEFYKVPSFYIDVPMQQNRDNVEYVADQLRDLAEFLKEHTGKKLDEERLKERLRRGDRTMKRFRECRLARADKYIPTDLVTPLYVGMTSNILLGTKEQEHYMELLLKDIRNAGPSRGSRIYWMHTIPYWSGAVKEALAFNEGAHIVGCELSQVFDPAEVECVGNGESVESVHAPGGGAAACRGTGAAGDARAAAYGDGAPGSAQASRCGSAAGDAPVYDPEKPYEAMAVRMVYNNLNGGVNRRIEAGIRHARELKADGAVWFCHWGCKRTLGGSQLAKKRFEEAGIPLLILDGDGCDSSHGGEGQTSTRLGAFLEMLSGSK